MSAATYDVFRKTAQARLPRFLFDYIDGGANDERTSRWNAADLANIPLRQRVLRDVSDISLETSLFGQRLKTPIALGPIGLAGLYAKRGEVQAMRAAAAHGIPFCLSTVSACSLQEVRDAAQHAPWFQLYMLRDRGFMRDLLATANGTGVSVLVFTVDMPAPGCRHRDAHSGMMGRHAALRRAFQAAMHPQWAWNVGVHGRPHILGNLTPALQGRTSLSDFIGWIGNNFDPSVRWDDLDWVRKNWSGTLVIKGIMDPDDARSAIAAGADGLIVSNHGGRQLDGVPSTVSMLPRIAEAVRGERTILVDSGIRSGLDVLRMLASGAQGVLLGRAWAYALAASGETGVRNCLATLDLELRTAMALTGVRRIEEIDRSCLVNADEG